MRILLIIPVFLTSCLANPNELLQALSLDECEIGEVEIVGQISTGIPWLGGSLNVNIKEIRTAETLPGRCLDGPNN